MIACNTTIENYLVVVYKYEKYFKYVNLVVCYFIFEM